MSIATDILTDILDKVEYSQTIGLSNVTIKLSNNINPITLTAIYRKLISINCDPAFNNGELLISWR